MLVLYKIIVKIKNNAIIPNSIFVCDIVCCCISICDNISPYCYNLKLSVSSS